jgi:hypothetical protein
MGLCEGEIWGTWSTLDGAGWISSPPGATTEQAERIVVKYLQDNPQELNESSTVLIYDALLAVWPPKETGTKRR